MASLSLVKAQGSFILSNTKELHDEVDSLRARVKELEQALAELQSQVTPEPHPLLQASLKVVTETLKPVDKDVKTEPVEDEALIDTFGSLTIEPNGQTIWYGPHAGSEFYIPRMDQPPIAENSVPLPVDILLLSRTFPLKPATEASAIAAIRKQIRSHIPPENIAHDMCYAHFCRLAWSTSNKLWEEFNESVFKPIYAPGGSPDDDQVALLLIVLAISVQLDPAHPIFHPDSTRYYHLSRVSIVLSQDLLQSHSLSAIKYLQLLAFYWGISNEPDGPNKGWVATSLAIRLAQMSGLHRDNPQWDMYPEQAEQRRHVWWELISFETIQGFAMGRPRAINTHHFDTRMPHDEEDDGKPPTFNRIKYRWIAQGIGGLMDEVFGVKPPSYARTLKHERIDKDLRDWPLDSVPSIDDVTLNSPDDATRKFMILLMRSFATTGLREISLLYLHRRYFVEALARYPEEPLRSKYAMSVLAVHRSSVLLLQGIQRLNGLIGNILPRVVFMWLHGLSAYVCLCAIVIKSPGCSLARSCLVEIDRTKDLFTRVVSMRLAHALVSAMRRESWIDRPDVYIIQPVVTKLYEQAHLAMNMHKEGKWPPNDPNSKSEDEEVDVMRFAGRPNFVSVLDSKDTPTSLSTPEPTTAGGSPPHHPLLTEYLKKFQSCNDGDAHAMNCIGFPPEQSMFPPIMSLPDGSRYGGMDWGEHISASSNATSSVGAPGATPADGLSPNGFCQTFAPLDKGMGPTFPGFSGMSPYLGTQMNQEMFIPDASALSYINGSHPVTSLSQFQTNEPSTSDDGWQEFLTGLQVLPQDTFSTQDWKSPS
ncbi:hypothetical protein FRC17_002157 [Serendipita sp. 399]|nr:hypothetical protein FRC17_002157 [Serendipita sp. 399]